LLPALHRFTEDQLGLVESLGKALVILLTDTATGDIIGGPWGSTYLGRLQIGILFVPEALLGTGLGTRMVRMAEAEAVRRGCNGVWAQSFDLQARGFYERLGYSVIDVLDDCPRVTPSSS
jgi:GNAT superfamily N-acetyltransferase